jgi:hypothetical protein
MNPLSSILSAFGLSTAAGLNAYIPLLTVGLVARYTDLIHLQAPYDLLANPYVLLIIAVLALIDFVGDKIPAIDSALHAVGLVVSPVAGAILFLATNSTTGSVSPVLAAICGLILAGSAHTARATARPLATATTGGVANPVISIFEDSAALVLSALAVVLPFVAFVLVLLFAVLMVLLLRRVLRRRAERRDGRM